ncbi:MAG TPA: copper-binding protein [Rhodanobacter sp.]
MKRVKTLAIPALMALAVLVPPAAQAQARMEPNKMDGMKMGMPATEGEIRKVDKAAGTLTIKHGEIKNMGMSPMTMAFPVKDKAMLDLVQAGDKVMFKVGSEGGKMVITELQPAK